MASTSMRCRRTQWQCQTTTAFVIARYLLFVQIALATPFDELNCLKLKTPGATFPSGDILIEYGSPLEIFCILDPKRTDRNASSLIFETNNKEVPEEHVEIVNSTTLRLFIDQPIPSNSMYYCKLRAEPEKNLSSETVCLNDVAVGFKPQEVKNFSCISMNWENLTCTWDLPVNFFKTTTNLEYYLPGRAGGRFSYPCPETMGKHENKCFWDRSTSVVYRQPYENYYFKMTISNPLGNITQKFKFHHYAYVIPSKPVNSTVVSKTSNSVSIQWSVGFPMQSFPPGVLQRVEYKSEWDSRDTWHSVDVRHLNPKNKTHALNITGLKYAHSFYDIRIYMKSPQANGDDKWSKPATLTVKTLPDVPGAPPKTDIGSFEVSRGLPYRDIYVYWQRIPDYLNNGDKFEYQVFDVNENGEESLFIPDESDKAYARFKSLIFTDYHFRIYSVNEKGRSKTGSDILIPAVQDIVSEPLTFTKIAFDNRIYELSWKKPADYSAKIESYTIFWCDNKKDRPFQCNGYLNWTHVGKDTVIKNITVPEDKVYQFAVSANSKNSSSGMVWASCTVIHNKVIGKMKSVWINSIGSTYIELGWKLECSDRVGVVKGFRIYFCPLASPRAKDCKGGNNSNMTIIGDPLTGHVNVTGLIPYTTYVLSVAVITKSGEGLQSDVLFNTTLEDAPDPPRNVRISNLTNTSMVVDWDAPLNMNGVLRSYSVQVSSSEGTVTKETIDLKMMLTNLQSYTLYSVSVSARTTLSSVYVSAPTVRTMVGVPGVVEQPIISPISSGNNLNKSQMEINWTPPNNPRGKIDYYEVMLTQLNENANESDVRPVHGNKIVVEMECEGVEHLGRSMRYMIYVRAVNVRVDDDKNVTLVGPWSSPGLRSCYNAGFPGYLQFCIILFIMMAVVSVLFGCAYFVNRCYRFCQDCRSVGAKLPTPFNTQNLEKDAETHKRMHGFQTDVMKIDPDRNVTDCIYRNHPAPDQELLLFKKAENECDGDGDSSGCSSAHESVSSSLTSGTHISDSGTEDQPESPTLLPALRQRIISSSSRDVRSVPDQYVMIGSSENSLNTGEVEPSYSRFPPKGGTGYCVVGNAPQDYLRVSVPSNSQVPAVTTSGYVSHPPARSDNKISPPSVTPGSKGYVMAGSLPVVESQTEKKPSTSYCRLGITGDFIMLPSTSKNPSDS